MILEKNGVSLYYEVRGEGAPLMLIHGVVVDAWLFERTAKILSKYYKVITFDRRGSSRSIASEDATYDVDAQIEDVKDLLDALKIEKVMICGVSAGAVVGQYFLQNYPERVDKLIMYECPLVSLLDEEDESHQWVDMMKDLIARRKLNTAALKFMQSIGSTDTRAPEKPEEISLREMGNIHHFLKDEYAVFLDYMPDVEKTKALADKIAVVVGEKSGDGPYPVAAKYFANMIGAKLLYYPGYHNVPSELPKEFAINVHGTLEFWDEL